jgi:hypothetical protein
MFVARHGTAISPTNDAIVKYKALYVGGAGTLNVRLAGDTANTSFGAVPAGTTLWISVTSVHLTGTSATSIVGLN